jgi:HTH-type transcriptional regulator, transcriptional repressor of NAD biosynthesis genes
MINIISNMIEAEKISTEPFVRPKEKIIDTSLVVGKFYPPHKGHKYLIDSAETQSKHTTVIIFHNEGYKIPGELRAGWLREIHPNVEVMLRPDKIPDGDDSVRWAENTLMYLGFTPQVIFSSEEYGVPFAKAMGSTHISVDKRRETVPISGTQIRNNPLDNLDFLEPCVRSYFTKRICVLGAESTGTTTMAKALADYYQTTWISEFGRAFSQRRMQLTESAWRESEFALIAKEQQEMEEQRARVANKVLICDTNAFATEIWQERYMGRTSNLVSDIGDKASADLYLLTDVDIPFVQDGTRDGEHVRHWMHRRFVDELTNRHYPFVVLSGKHEDRLKEAISAVNSVMKS